HRYQEEHYQATWDRFLRENGHLFNAFMLSPRAEPLRSLIGAGTRYHDPAVMRDRLRTHTAEREREERRKIYEREQPAPAERRTSSGIILPGHEAEEGEEEKPRASTILIPGRDF
ncbi:MAG: hypothetical protein H5T69_09725, partial [Chloroflexi bacterium]|nr:hypothetical protein [Chloroflexota bacterium]